MYSIFQIRTKNWKFGKMGSSFLVTYAKLKLEHKQSFVHRTKMLTIVLTILLKCLGMKVFSLMDLSV